MGVLSELGVIDRGSILLIDPPPSALAEAGTLKPRPGVVNSIATARPANRILWWPARDDVTQATMGQLAWLVSAARGEAWVVVDPTDEDSASLDAAREAITVGGLRPAEEVALSTGERALRLT